VIVSHGIINVMPDVYNVVAELPQAVADQLADAMELRAADPQQQAMLATYLVDLDLPEGARVLEIGCGTGAISRVLATRQGIREVVGVDPSPVFLARAERLAAGMPGLSFQQGDGQSLPIRDASFDAVIVHTVLCHVLEPEQVLAQASRVLRPAGRIGVFEGDYNTMSVATSDLDPLQACATAFVSNYVHDRWIVRRLPAMVSAAGFAGPRLRSYGYAQITDAAYLLSVVDRGADALAAGGHAGPELVRGLKAEARRRVQASVFFGYIAYASLTASKKA